MTVPNIITLGRFVLVPIVLWGLLSGEVVIAFLAFVLAGVSDGVDGYIARRFGQHTELGAYLDPIADKALLVSTFVMLGYLGELPLWLVTLVVSRDCLILGAVILASMLSHPVQVRPLMISKINTAFQIGLAVVTLGELAVFGRLPAIHAVLVGSVTVLTIGSGIAYFLGWLRHMRLGGLVEAGGYPGAEEKPTTPAAEPYGATAPPPRRLG